MSPKVLTVDIENAPNVAEVWGYYEQTPVRVLRNAYILMVGTKWLHEKKSKIWLRSSFDKKDKTDDPKLLKKIWDLLDEADIVITQNGDKFDIPKLNTAFIKAGFPPYSPFRSVDTKKAASRHFYFTNNKLDNLGEELGLGKKMSHEGYSLWEGVMSGDPKAIKKMSEYCKRDVELTEDVYLKLRPWMKNHPNMNIFTDRPECCPKCLCPDLQSRGERPYSDNTIRKMWRCKDCGTPIYGERVPREKLTLK